MRISKVVIATVSLVAGAGTGTIAVEALTSTQPSPTTVMLQRQVQEPAEDDPGFNCIRHGNRACGVRLDPTPNNGSTEVRRYVIQFNKTGQPVSVKPLGR